MEPRINSFVTFVSVLLSSSYRIAVLEVLTKVSKGRY